MKYVWVFFENLFVKVKVWLKSDNNGHFTGRPVYIMICPWILLIMRKFSGESCRQNQNTHFAFDNFSPSTQIVRSLNNVEKYGRGRQNRIRRMRFACRVTNARIHTQYFTLVALPWHERLRERASVLNYMYCFFLVFWCHTWGVSVAIFPMYSFSLRIFRYVRFVSIQAYLVTTGSEGWNVNSDGWHDLHCTINTLRNVS